MFETDNAGHLNINFCIRYLQLKNKDFFPSLHIDSVVPKDLHPIKIQFPQLTNQIIQSVKSHWKWECSRKIQDLTYMYYGLSINTSARWWKRSFLQTNFSNIVKKQALLKWKTAMTSFATNKLMLDPAVKDSNQGLT